MPNIYTQRSGATAHPEDLVLQLPTDMVSASGVVDLSTHFKITAQTVPDMTVQAATGRAYIKGASSNCYPVRSDGSMNATITANGSGNSRIDAVVLYIDLSAVPATDANNVAKLYVKAGTPAGSPVAPSDADIQTAIGASNPFLRLANVTVASGATSITNGNISDTRIALVNSGIFYTRRSTVIQAQVVTGTTVLTTGDGKYYFRVPEELNGMNLTAVHARVITAPVGSTIILQLANVTDGVDMLSTRVTIDATETGSDTATAYVIDTTKDDVATGDLLRLDCDQVGSSTPGSGLIWTMRFALPS